MMSGIFPDYFQDRDSAMETEVWTGGAGYTKQAKAFAAGRCFNLNTIYDFKRENLRRK